MDQIIDLLPTLLALVATGVFAGLLAGLLGVGGGIVIVPVLYFLFQQFGVSPESAMVIATGTSLATIIPTSISSIRAHRQKGNVDVQLLSAWAPFILAGVLLGAWLVTQVNGNWLTALFGTIAVLSALNMLLRTEQSALADTLPGPGGQRVMASGIGLFSAMVGIGGGTLTVPTLTFCSYPAHRAVGTAAAVGLLISLPAALMLLLVGVTPPDAPWGTFGYVNLLGFACIVPLTVFFAPLGARLAQAMDAKRLKKVFAVVLLFTGARMFAQLLF